MELTDKIFEVLKEISNRSDLSRKQKAGLKRKTLVKELHNVFMKKMKETADLPVSIEWMEGYLRMLIYNKPQEKSFYLPQRSRLRWL